MRDWIQGMGSMARGWWRWTAALVVLAAPGQSVAHPASSCDCPCAEKPPSDAQPTEQEKAAPASSAEADDAEHDDAAEAPSSAYAVEHFVPPQSKTGWREDLKAAELTRNAKKLARAGDCQQAVPLYSEAYRVRGKSDALRGAVACAKSEEEWVHAYHLMKLANESHPEKVPAIQAQRDAELEEIAGHTAVLELAVEPTDARLSVDGVTHEAGALRLLPGKHTVRAEKDGFEVSEQQVELAGGDLETVELRLAEVKPPPPATSDRGEVLDLCQLAPAESSGSYVRQRLVMFDIGGEEVTHGPEQEVNEKGEIISGVEHHVFASGGMHEHVRNVFGTTFPMERFYTVKVRVPGPEDLQRKPSISHEEMIRAASVDPFAAYSIACADWVIAPRVVGKDAKWQKVKKKKIVDGKEVEYQAWSLDVVWRFEIDAYEYTPSAWKLVSTLKGSNGGALGAAFALASMAPTGNPEDESGPLLVSNPPEPTCNVPLVGAARQVAEGFLSCGSALKKAQAQARVVLEASETESTKETSDATTRDGARTPASPTVAAPGARAGTDEEDGEAPEDDGETAASGDVEAKAGDSGAEGDDATAEADAKSTDSSSKDDGQSRLGPEDAARLRAIVSADPTSAVEDLAAQKVGDKAPPGLAEAVAAAQEAAKSCQGGVSSVIDLAGELRSPPSLDGSMVLGFAACAGIKLQFDLGESVAPGTAQARSAFCKEIQDDVALGAVAMIDVARCQSRVAAEQATLAAQKAGKRLDGWKLFANLQQRPDGEKRGFGIAMGKDEGAKRGDVYIAVDRSDPEKTKRLGWGRIIARGPGGAEGADHPSHFKFRSGSAELGTRMEEWAQIGVLLGAHPGLGLLYSNGDLDSTALIGGGISGGYNASPFVSVGDEFWSRVDIGFYKGSGDEFFVTIDLAPEAQFYLFNHASFAAISGLAMTIASTKVTDDTTNTSVDVSGMGMAVALGGALDWAFGPDFNLRATTRLHQGFHKVKLKGEDKDTGTKAEIDGGTLSQLQFLVTGVYTF